MAAERSVCTVGGRKLASIAPPSSATSGPHGFHSDATLQSPKDVPMSVGQRRRSHVCLCGG